MSSSLLADHLPKQTRDANEAKNKDERPDIRNAEKINRGVCHPKPEKRHGPKGRHRIGLAGELRHNDEGGEGREGLDRVGIGPVRACPTAEQAAA